MLFRSHRFEIVFGDLVDVHRNHRHFARSEVLGKCDDAFFIVDCVWATIAGEYQYDGIGVL